MKLFSKYLLTEGKKDLLFVHLCYISIVFTGCHVSGSAAKSGIIVNQWEKVAPGGGGAVFIPTFTYSSKNRFLIRCDMTGSYLSSDRGNSYQQIDLPGEPHHLHGILLIRMSSILEYYRITYT